MSEEFFAPAASTEPAPTRAAPAEPENLLDYLERKALAQKLIDIAISQTNCPPRLRDDAAQDIRIMWMGRMPDTQRYGESQIASYAHRIARHAALRCRRELGSACRLPGSAFRKRKDGSTYIQPGTIANPLSWDEMDEWFSLEDQPEAALNGNNCAQLAEAMASEDSIVALDAPVAADPLVADALAEGVDFMELADHTESGIEEELVVGHDSEDERRQEEFQAIAKHLNPRAREIIVRLLAGESLQIIQQSMCISQGIVTREIKRAAEELPQLRAQLAAGLAG